MKVELPSPVPATVLDDATDAAIVFDLAGRVRGFNAAAERLWGHPREAVLGWPLRRLVPGLPLRPPGRRGRASADAPAAAGGNSMGSGGAAAAGRGFAGLYGTRGEFALAVRDGSARWGDISFSPLAAGAEALCLAIVRDVTDEVYRREALRHLSRALDDGGRATLIADERCRIVHAGATFAARLGLSCDDLEGRPLLLALARSKVRARALQRLFDGAGPGDVRQELLLVCDESDREHWMAVTIERIDGAGGAKWWRVALNDLADGVRLAELRQHVLESLARDASLRQAMETLCWQVTALAPDTAVAVAMVDRDRRLRVLAGPGLPPAYLAGLDGMAVDAGADGCGVAVHRGEAVLTEDIAEAPSWARHRRHLLPVGLRACWSHPVTLPDGRVGGVLAFHFGERRGPEAWHERIAGLCVPLCALAIGRHEARRRIVRLAYRDPLTGLPNRAALLRRLARAIAPAIPAAPPPRQVAFMVLDLDRFKSVNDRLGHPAGDALLVEVARRLRMQLRAVDTIGRLGGDEFVIVLPDCGARGAAEVAGRLIAALDAPAAIHGELLRVSASIGIALHPDHGDDADALLARADRAMYEAKRLGGGCHRFPAVAESEDDAQRKAPCGA